MVEFFIELEKGLKSLEDEEPKEMSTIDIPIEKLSDTPKLIFEPLISKLKYVFLRDDKTT